MEHDYARAFRIIRAAAGLRQSELAERMPISASQLSLIEAGKRQPSIRVVNALAAAVGIPAPLISLLASGERDFELTPNEDISNLARTLLRVLIAAGSATQATLKFKE